MYETALLGWVISQLEWIARRTPPPLRRTLFDTLVPILADYSSEALAAALREGNKGQTARRLSAAVAKRDYGSFVRTLSSRPDTNNPFSTAAFHLRHSGVRHTATLTGRYLRTVMNGSRVAVPSASSGRLCREPRGQDVMFGLMVIQHQLGDLSSQLKL